MLVNGTPTRTIWPADARGRRVVEIIDQTRLPHVFEIVRLTTAEDAARAIADMHVRGAPLIGATAAYGFALGLADDPSDAALGRFYEALFATRPTAVNLRWALDAVRAIVAPLPAAERAEAAFAKAAAIADADVALCSAIGDAGLPLIERVAAQKSGPVTILTHCNAGWLATVDWGTATAPIYKAHQSGIDVFVWVDETRPRLQGAALTAWELGGAGVPHAVIVDNAGGHLMQQGAVDLCLVGSDRTTRNGDVCNKIGTYLKALAAHDNDVPFYVALPSPTLDMTLASGADVPIEERSNREVHEIWGDAAAGLGTVRITPTGSQARNPAFDVTPARLVTGLVTERGVIDATKAAILDAFPERCAA